MHLNIAWVLQNAPIHLKSYICWNNETSKQAEDWLDVGCSGRVVKMPTITVPLCLSLAFRLLSDILLFPFVFIIDISGVLPVNNF